MTPCDFQMALSPPSTWPGSVTHTPLKYLKGQIIARSFLSAVVRGSLWVMDFVWVFFFFHFVFHFHFTAPQRTCCVILGAFVVSLLRKFLTSLLLSVLPVSPTSWRPMLQFVCAFRTVRSAWVSLWEAGLCIGHLLALKEGKGRAGNRLGEIACILFPAPALSRGYTFLLNGNIGMIANTLLKPCIVPKALSLHFCHPQNYSEMYSGEGFPCTIVWRGGNS